MNFDTFFSNLSDKASTYLDDILEAIPQELAATVDFLPTIKLTVLLIAVVLAFGIVFRLICGRDSSLNRALSSAIGILFLYAVTIVIHTLNPWKLARYVSPLPFAVFQKSTLVILPFSGSAFSVLCSNLLSLVILCFLVNLLDAIIPRGKTVLSWGILRIISVVAAIFVNLIVSGLLKLYLPGILVEYAPIAILGLLVFLFLLGISKILLGIILTAVNPIIGILYTFFFSNVIGKQISKAVLSTIILCLVFYFLEFSGYTVISVTASALLSYIPFAASLLVLWFLLGHEL